MQNRAKTVLNYPAFKIIVFVPLSCTKHGLFVYRTIWESRRFALSIFQCECDKQLYLNGSIYNATDFFYSYSELPFSETKTPGNNLEQNIGVWAGGGGGGGGHRRPLPPPPTSLRSGRNPCVILYMFAKSTGYIREKFLVCPKRFWHVCELILWPPSPQTRLGSYAHGAEISVFNRNQHCMYILINILTACIIHGYIEQRSPVYS